MEGLEEEFVLWQETPTMANGGILVTGGFDVIFLRSIFTHQIYAEVWLKPQTHEFIFFLQRRTPHSYLSTKQHIHLSKGLHLGGCRGLKERKVMLTQVLADNFRYGKKEESTVKQVGRKPFRERVE